LGKKGSKLGVAALNPPPATQELISTIVEGNGGEKREHLGYEIWVG